MIIHDWKINRENLIYPDNIKLGATKYQKQEITCLKDENK